MDNNMNNSSLPGNSWTEDHVKDVAIIYSKRYFASGFFKSLSIFLSIKLDWGHSKFGFEKKHSPSLVVPMVREAQERDRSYRSPPC